MPARSEIAPELAATRNGKLLTIETVAGIARNGTEIGLADEARSAVAGGARFLSDLIAEGRPIYALRQDSAPSIA